MIQHMSDNTIRCEIRLTPVDKSRLGDIAERDAISVSDVLRRLLRAEIRRVDAEDALLANMSGKIRAT